MLEKICPGKWITRIESELTTCNSRDLQELKRGPGVHNGHQCHCVQRPHVQRLARKPWEDALNCTLEQEDREGQ